MPPQSRPETNAIGGVWPLGTFTITSGTPIALTSIVGAQKATQPFSASCRQLTLSTPGNTGLVYINDGPFAGRDVNRTVAVIGPNQPYVGFPNDPLTESVLDISRYYIDGSSSGDKVTICASDSSN
ncbi:MAG TPA: hypothetical protein VGK96_28265 [Candidatus Sulfotelmatobacter sp.]|jgi:hypothetical protein